MVTYHPFRQFLLEDRLTDSYWSVKSTCDTQSSNGVVMSLRIVKLSLPLFTSSIPSQKAAPLLWHHIMNRTLLLRNFLPCFSDIPCYWKWLEDILGCNKERLIEGRLYDGLYVSLFFYHQSLNVFKALCELWCHTTKYQHLLHREWRHVNLLIGHADYKWTSADRYFYKKVVPSARELLSARQDDKPSMICTFLFSPFHILCQDVNGVVQLATS